MDMFTEAERNYRCYAQQKQMLEKLKLERPLTEGEEEDLQSMDPLILLRPVSITAVRLPIVACLTPLIWSRIATRIEKNGRS